MTYAQGRAALARTELFGPIIAQVGRCALKPEKREPYEALVRAIAHQQVHGRAAEAMLGRLSRDGGEHQASPSKLPESRGGFVCMRRSRSCRESPSRASGCKTLATRQNRFARRAHA